MANTKYPRGVEVVVGVFIFGADGRVALINSPKWKSVGLLPAGGHLEAGETIAQCAVREAHEETGLNCEYLSILNTGQLFSNGKTNYHRVAHLLYFHALLTTSDTKLVPLADEVNTLAWYDPNDISTISQLDAVGQDSLKKANAYFRGEFELMQINS